MLDVTLLSESVAKTFRKRMKIYSPTCTENFLLSSKYGKCFFLGTK